MIDKDSSIITQVAAKIAGDIAVQTGGGGLENTLNGFSKAFEVVKAELFEACAIDLAAQYLGATQAPANVSAPTYQAPAAAAGALQIQGTQHGPLPAWIEAATQKAGVRKVWDNRDKAEGTKRPHFKQADQAQGTEPVAFWPPKAA